MEAWKVETQPENTDTLIFLYGGMYGWLWSRKEEENSKGITHIRIQYEPEKKILDMINRSRPELLDDTGETISIKVKSSRVEPVNKDPNRRRVLVWTNWSGKKKFNSRINTLLEEENERLKKENRRLKNEIHMLREKLDKASSKVDAWIKEWDERLDSIKGGNQVNIKDLIGEEI